MQLADSLFGETIANSVRKSASCAARVRPMFMKKLRDGAKSREFGMLPAFPNLY
jgi:hypothetical protein